MLKASLFLLLFIPLTGVIAASALVSTLADATGRLYYRHAVLWARLSLLLAGVRVVVEGREKVPVASPVIFMSNHQSNFDILALFLAIPGQFSWIAKEELFRIPVFGHSMSRAGYIPLDRSDGRRALKSMDAAARRIRNGESVVIFPEGTRTVDGSLLPFKQGGFLLAGKAGVPVVPVTINGSGKINPSKRLELRSGVIRISFSDPLLPSGSAPQERERLMQRVQDAIGAVLEAGT
ncbi:1-acyl-sn-glycerol-3-phosphate acyltransferase [Geobacter sp. DSM 9736]|uniref:lysophospholipid acyltransferase family protein n=1 Tax=Geobacter sp. DSM 9736 TaxID=1277350 RepID=UPI000B507644|nr:lysophospholipid acyltransferase family protein [Geobacter sp. DSM 9736]